MQPADRPIQLDGSLGEGGGQILRSALSLSMITGIPFRIQRIRAGRQKPGLLRQHLTAVKAATEISGAHCEGAGIGSQTLSFTPGQVKGGDYRFAIGSAGSCTLVLQTLLPALWFAKAPSRISISGGTHNSMAPPADFLVRVWLPLLRRMGVENTVEVQRHGFYPAGGGELVASVTPCSTLRRLDLADKGERLSLRAEALIAGLPYAIAQRELERIKAQIANVDTRVRELPAREGPGNVLMFHVEHEHITELFCAFGEKGMAAEVVADQAGKQMRHYLHSPAAVGEYLADQLLLPMALAGGGSFTTTHLSAHLHTNLQVIGQFLPVRAEITSLHDNLHRVSVSATSSPETPGP